MITMSERHMAGEQHSDRCKCLERAAAVQGLDELEFERGIWTAALYNDLDRLSDRITRAETNRRDNYGYTALHYAARQNHWRACELLLAAGAEVDARTKAGGVTPLHRAAAGGHLDATRVLLAGGARPQLADDDGNTALHRAAAAGHHPVCALLLAQHPDLPAALNKRQQTAADLVNAERRPQFRDLLGVIAAAD